MNVYTVLVPMSALLYCTHKLHFQNWAEMNHECCDGNPIRFLLSAPVRLTILLLLGNGLNTFVLIIDLD